MAERKSAFRRAPERPDLEMLYEAARKRGITDEEMREQAASWVYGNAPAGSNITKESARAAVLEMRLRPPSA